MFRILLMPVYIIQVQALHSVQAHNMDRMLHRHRAHLPFLPPNSFQWEQIISGLLMISMRMRILAMQLMQNARR